ncbi:hypothetical protein [uncultured Maribacter sp.]|uniref:hypothetical protein n=1 Tax=uncultured Maribacter sp. TaxID=431308 RepID=UPI002607DB66|nr:hypothetical protein [uncultured Maribacter sp.]
MQSRLRVYKEIVFFIKRRVSIILVAFILGMSNVILEETRMIYDTRKEIELQEIQEEDSIK